MHRLIRRRLDMVPLAKNQGDRIIQREMAAEWIKLAETILRPLAPLKLPE
jgi:hypothetical protein